ncbi:MAG: CPBP family intramembrane metalloprotease [Lachnospiraceae bacterium]|nr:CPBP family intramembrane metalloprotease [Lachnospiraceae bacterium]
MIPIINISLMVKSLFAFKYDYALYGIVLLCNVVYSVLTVMILARLYNSESVLFSEGFTNINIFTKRSEMKKGSMAGDGDALLLLCVALMILFYIGTYATLRFGIYGVGVQQLIILALPLAYAWYIKGDMRKIFSFRKPGAGAIVSALFLAIGCFITNLVLSFGLAALFKESAQNVQETFSALMDEPFALLLVVAVILPAIGEELLFRGFLFSSIRQKCRSIATVLIVSALFGLFHLSLIKFFTTAFLGIILALLVEKSGSIVPGMLVHFLNNLLSMIISVYESELSERVPMLAKDVLSGVDIVASLAVGLIFLCIGILFLFRMGGKKQPQA